MNRSFPHQIDHKLLNDVRDHVTFIYGFMKTLRKNLAKRESHPTPCSGNVKLPRRKTKKLTIKTLLLRYGRQDGQIRPSDKANFFYLPCKGQQYLKAKVRTHYLLLNKLLCCFVALIKLRGYF